MLNNPIQKGGLYMATTKAQIEASKRYILKTYDDIKLRVPKGKREEYKKIVYALGYESFNSFVISAIDEKIAREARNE